MSTHFFFALGFLFLISNQALSAETEQECSCEATLSCEGSTESGYYSLTSSTSKACIKRLSKPPSSIIRCSKPKIDVDSVKYSCASSGEQSEAKNLNCEKGQGKRLCRIIEQFKTVFSGDCTSGCNQRLPKLKKLSESLEFWYRFIGTHDLKPAADVAKLARESVLAICRRNTFALTGSSAEAQAWFTEMREHAVKVQEYLSLIQAWGGVDFVEECPRVDFFVK